MSSEPHRRSNRPCLETLESRALLASASLNNSALITLGGSVDRRGGSDTLSLELTSDRLAPATITGRSLLDITVQATDGAGALKVGRVRLIGPNGRRTPLRMTRFGSGVGGDVNLKPGDYSLQVRGRGLSTGTYITQVNLVGDVNGDRQVDQTDLNMVRSMVDQSSRGVSTFGFSPNGRVTTKDLSLAENNLGATCKTVTLKFLNSTFSNSGSALQFPSNQIYISVFGQDPKNANPNSNPSGWSWFDKYGNSNSLYGFSGAMQFVPSFTLSQAPNGVEIPRNKSINSGEICIGLGSPVVLPVNIGVSNVAVTSPGIGYTSAPTVVFSGGTAASAVISPLTLTNVELTDAGVGYTSAPHVVISGGGGSGATATAQIASGMISALTLTNAGSGYTSAPTVSFVGGGGSQAAATAVVTGGVSQVNVPPGATGSGYTKAPSVTLAGGGGTGATARASLTSSVLTGVYVNSGGSGYTSSPTVQLSGGGGSGAAAQAIVTGGVITGFNILNPGSGYLLAPKVSITGGGGSGATAVAVIGTVVSSVTVTNPGSGYTAAPTVYFSGGTGALASAQLSGSSVRSVTVTAPGTGYLTPPNVSLMGGGGFGARATAQVAVTGVAIPSPSNPTDPNRQVYWNFAEFTMNYPVQPAPYINADLSQVDLVGYPMTLQLKSKLSGDSPVVGIYPDRRWMIQKYEEWLRTLSQPEFNSLATNTGAGNNGIMRLLAPGDYVKLHNDDPLAHYYDGYISNVFKVGNAVNIQVAEVNKVIPATGVSLLNGSGGVASIAVTNPGGNYTFPPLITILGGGGSGASAVATLNPDGTVNSNITITNPGSGYTSAPNIAFTPGSGTYQGTVTTLPAGATGVAVLNGSRGVASVQMTNFGTGYLSAPTVTFSGGGGNGAQGTAVLVGNQVASIQVTNPGSGYTSAPNVTIGPGAYTVYQFTGQTGRQKGAVFHVYSPLTQPSWDEQLDSSGLQASWSPTWMVFANTGVFADNVVQYPPASSINSKVLGNIENQLVAAMSRGVALLPYASWSNSNDFYPAGTPANWYAWFLHVPQISINGLAYGFPYDDQGNNSTDISVNNPDALVVNIGWNGNLPTTTSQSETAVTPSAFIRHKPHGPR
jgi:hypothetical protein